MAKKFWLGMSVMALVFGMTLVACNRNQPAAQGEQVVPSPSIEIDFGAITDALDALETVDADLQDALDALEAVGDLLYLLDGIDLEGALDAANEAADLLQGLDL